MVRTKIHDNILELNLSPLHKILAFKGSLRIPLAAIASVERDLETAKAGPKGVRFPGTGIPFLLHAGSYYSGLEKAFWDVHNPANAITIRLRKQMLGTLGEYDKVVVEVADAETAVTEIQRALSGVQ